jgi:hypothetical protein
MALAWVANGGDGIQVQRIDVNLLNKQSWSYTLGVGRGVKIPHLKKICVLENVTQGLDFGKDVLIKRIVTKMYGIAWSGLTWLRIGSHSGVL